MSGLRPTLLPAQPFEPKPLFFLAMRAGDEETALVGRLVLALDPRQAMNRRRRPQQDLGPPRECAGSGLGQRDRVAFLVGRRRISVDLVQKQVARRHRAQADRAVGAGDHQQTRRKLLRQHGVAGVARSRRPHALPQRRALADQRIDALAREALGEFDGRLHREHRPGRVVDHVADPVVAAFREADLRRLHHHDAPRRVHWRERVDDLPDVGSAIRPITSGLRRGARAQQSMSIRPLRNGERRVGQQSAAPSLAQLIGAVEPKEII